MVTLGFTITIDGLDDDSLVVRSFEGEESLSDTPYKSEQCVGFRYNIDLASRRGSIKPQQVIDRNAELRIYHDGKCVQRVHGIVRQFTQGDIGYHYTYYSLTLVPALERLSLRRNSRIFQQKTAVEMVSTLLEEMGVQEFAFSLRRKCQPREFCVQYRETDLEFLHRLAAEEGWVYSFEHLEGKHTVLFSDTSTVLPSLKKPIIHNSRSGAVIEEPYISSFSKQTQSEVAKVSLKDYSFKTASYLFSNGHYASDLDYQRDSYEHYDYPGRYKNDKNGQAFSKIRLEYLRRTAHMATGDSDQPLLRAGCRFDMVDHLDSEMNCKWVVVSITHKGSQPQALEEEGFQGATTYSNHFHVIPSSRNWRATPCPKPQVDGPMIAMVVGPPGEEIFCDKHGRVKVHFPWDRESKKNENSSCWIRVSQGWAGGGYGAMAIPRIGHEVIVSFLNGDPDQPIITGRTYHAANIPPYILPNHKTRTVLKTQTHLGKGFNEVRFEDEASREQIYIHAQKDKDVVINHISRESIGSEFHQKICKHFIQMVGENTHRMVGKNVTEEFGQDHHYKVGRNLIQRIIGAVNRFISGGMVTKIEGGSVTSMSASEEKEIGANQRIAVNNESYLKATDIVLEAKQELTIKGPGGFIKIDSGGITISGKKVKVNEGGAPGKGTEPKAVEPQQPDKPQQPDDPDRRN